MSKLCERLEIAITREEIKDVEFRALSHLAVSGDSTRALRTKFKLALSEYIEAGWIPMGEPKEEYSYGPENWNISIWVWCKK
jgi:hypothetical protein